MKFISKNLTFVFLLVLMIGCSSPKQIKVISFNLRNASDYATREDGDNCWMNRRDAQLRMVKEENPDFFAVQECLLVQEEFFSSNLENYGMIGVGRDDGDKAGEFESIYYNKETIELISTGNFWLSETPDIPSKGWDGWNIRMATWGCFHIKRTDKNIFHFNTHLDLTDIAKREGAKLLASKISEIVPEGSSVILTGDFNTCPDEEILKPIFEIFSDSRAIAPDSDSKSSFNGWNKESSGLIVDYVFESNLKPLRFRTLDGDYGVPFISDHYPVSAVIEL